MKKIYLFIIWFLMTGWDIYAQHPSFWQLTDEQGLPSATVFDLLQDTKGYIWMATESGLCRYDGNKFKLYKPSHAKASAVSHLTEDGKNRIWFLNFSGQLFYIQQDSVYEYKFPKELEKNFLAYHIDKKDQLFTLHGTHDWYIHQGKKATYLFEGHDQLAEYQTEHFVFFSQGHINFYQKGNLIKKRLERFSSTIGASFRHQMIGKWNVVVERAIDKIFLIDENRSEPLVETDFFDFTEGNTNGKKNIELNDIRSDNEQNIWMLTYSGLYGYNQQLKPLYTNVEGKATPLFAGKPISDILQDKEGNYWISTLSDGVFVIPNRKLLVFDEKTNALEDKHIYKITKDDDGNLLLGIYNGKIKVFQPEQQKIISEYITNNKKEVEALFFDNKNKKIRLWFKMYDNYNFAVVS